MLEKMQYRIKNFKFITKSLVIFLAATLSLHAQENKKKIDGVVAVVGEYVVLDSDVDKMYIELESQGVSTDNFSRCNLMGKLLEDKLYAHNAIQDSITVSNDEVESAVNQQIEYMKSQVKGDIDKVLKFYKKDDEIAFRKELFDLVKTNKLSGLMTRKIVENVEVSPEEVYTFFNEIPEKDRPTFGAELKVSQIIIKPKTPQVEIDKVIDKLKQFKADVLDNGASFASKAVLYSKDEGSRPTGGKYTVNRKKPRFVKEFREAAFSLEEGEISEPFKSEHGYHILMVDQIRGQEVDVRHILLMPEVSNVNLEDAKKLADTIRKRIIDKEITFQKAALEFSDEKETKFDGGKLRNPETYDHNFELTKMDPSLYSQVINLEEGIVSDPILEYDRTGKAFYKILLISDKKEEHIAEYGKDFLKIKELAKKEKQIKTVADWQTEKIKDTYIKITGEYRDCEFTNNWLKK
jgi:peptidyl-prolyl cis-trans isomerase SurA|tara:strand:- start:462 stop:1853 length:1392 start_codon:yes stop_codon:yes gene_type:complete